MNASLSKETSHQRTAWVMLAVLLVVSLALIAFQQIRRVDPYVQSVLSLPADVAQGKVIFQQNCSVCHGLYGDGMVGPSLHHVASRRSRVGLIHQVISGKTPPMPQFQPSPQEMADLLKYLEEI